jgi:hypothetical protein
MTTTGFAAGTALQMVKLGKNQEAGSRIDIPMLPFFHGFIVLGSIIGLGFGLAHKAPLMECAFR